MAVVIIRFNPNNRKYIHHNSLLLRRPALIVSHIIPKLCEPLTNLVNDNGKEEYSLL
jgi:hypothetical protein